MHAATRWNAPTAAVYRPHAANPVTIERSAQRAIDASAGRTASSPDRHASADGYIGRTAAFLDGDHPSGEDGVLGATMSDGSDALGNSFGAHAGARRAPRRAAPAAPDLADRHPLRARASRPRHPGSAGHPTAMAGAR